MLVCSSAFYTRFPIKIKGTEMFDQIPLAFVKSNGCGIIFKQLIRRYSKK